VWCIYKLQKNKILKAKGLQNIKKTLTMLELWTDVWVTVHIEAQWAHNAKNVQITEDLLAHCVQRNKVLLAHSARNARLWVGTPKHVLIRIGGWYFKWNSPPPAPNIAFDR
jgi:hypothetical protein